MVIGLGQGRSIKKLRIRLRENVTNEARFGERKGHPRWVNYRQGNTVRLYGRFRRERPHPSFIGHIKRDDCQYG